MVHKKCKLTVIVVDKSTKKYKNNKKAGRRKKLKVENERVWDGIFVKTTFFVLN
jgi:hypothetical protein